MFLLNINAIDSKLFAFCDPHLRTGTRWAREGLAIWLKGASAGSTSHFAGEAVEVQHSSLCDRPFGDDIPVELHRIVHDGRELPDHQVDVGYLPGIRLLGMTKGNVQNTLSYG